MSSHYTSSTQVAVSVPFDNSTNGFVSTNVQAAIEEVKTFVTNPLAEQNYYVTKNGNDTIGNGSIGSPYLTIGHTLSVITTSSPTARVVINVGPGDYAESFSLKANVFIKGSGPIATRITGATVDINDATWNNSSNDSRSGFQDLSLNNIATWDFTAQAGNTQGKLYFFNIRTGAAWTTTALNAINQLVIQDSELFGTTTFTGMTTFVSSTTWQSGNIVINSSTLAGVNTNFTADGSSIQGNLSATWSSPNANIVILLAGLSPSTTTIWTIAGSGCTVQSVDSSLPVPANRTFTGSAVLTRVNDNFAGGLLSATTNVSVSAATAPTAGQGLVATNSTTAVWGNVTSLADTEASATAAATAGTGADALMTGMTLTPAAGGYLVWFSCDLNSPTAGVVLSVSIYVGGVQKADSLRKIEPFAGGTLTSGSQRVGCATNGKVTVNGSQAIEIRWSASAGAPTVAARTLNILQVD